MSRKLAALERLYSSLPKLECKKLCHESCGPIVMEKVEWDRIVKRAGEVKATEITCPLLVAGECSVYTVRPMLCRLFGIVEAMKCPHGCVPSKWLTKQEGYVFLERVKEISRMR